MSALTFHRRLHVALWTELLAELPLGQDAANLWQPGRPTLDAVLEAYQAAPGRLTLQHLGLTTADLPCLLAALEGGVGGLKDPAGRRLGQRFAAALRSRAPAFVEAWRADEPAASARLKVLAGAIGAPLAALRAALYQGEPVPSLEVLDCRALGQHGRGAPFGSLRRVAVSAAEAPAHVLCQVLHEEIHTVTDRGVALGGRDTRVNGAGFALHREVERRAVARGFGLIEAAAPEYAEAYQAWVKRVGGRR